MKTGYEATSEFAYAFAQTGDYLIKAYTKSANGRYRTSAVVAEIIYDEENSIWQIKFEKEYNLIYQGQEYHKINEDTYQFYMSFVRK